MFAIQQGFMAKFINDFRKNMDAWSFLSFCEHEDIVERYM